MSTKLIVLYYILTMVFNIFMPCLNYWHKWIIELINCENKDRNSIINIIPKIICEFDCLQIITVLHCLGGFLSSKNILKYTEAEFRQKVKLTVVATHHVFIAAANISASNVK